MNSRFTRTAILAMGLALASNANADIFNFSESMAFTHDTYWSRGQTSPSIHVTGLALLTGSFNGNVDPINTNIITNITQLSFALTSISNSYAFTSTSLQCSVYCLTWVDPALTTTQQLSFDGTQNSYNINMIGAGTGINGQNIFFQSISANNSSSQTSKVSATYNYGDILFASNDTTTSLSWRVTDTTTGQTTPLPTPSPSSVPVPAAIWMFASGLLGLGAVRKRHKLQIPSHFEL